MMRSEHMKLLKLEDAAELVALSTRTLRRKIQSGELKGHKFGRLWRISIDDLQSFIDGKKSHRSYDL